jgi:hypothetical protein
VALRNRSVATETFQRVRDFVPDPRSIYVYGQSVEARSHHTTAWNSRDLTFITVTDQGPNEIKVLLGTSADPLALPLRSERQLRNLWRDNTRQTIYLDITGLDHHVWAPVLKSALSANRRVAVVYVEPEDYTLSPNPTEGGIFDLSERITGIRPIPGFASLGEEEEDFCFVPLLGFEGPRLAFVVEQVQPTGGKIIPIIGVPGFRPEYPFYTYLGNRLPLSETLAWRNVRYAAANCPFSLFYALEDIAARHPMSALKIAPIGTKPHALGAVLFCLARPRAVELVYDHPVRKASRTSGTSRLLVYHVSSLFIDTTRA